MQLESFSNFSTTFSVSVTFLRCWPGNCLNINRGEFRSYQRNAQGSAIKLKILDSIMQTIQTDQFLQNYLFLSQKANEPGRGFFK